MMVQHHYHIGSPLPTLGYFLVIQGDFNISRHEPYIPNPIRNCPESWI